MREGGQANRRPLRRSRRSAAFFRFGSDFASKKRNEARGETKPGGRGRRGGETMANGTNAATTGERRRTKEAERAIGWAIALLNGRRGWKLREITTEERE